MLSFKNKPEIKEQFIVSTYEWLNMKKNPKSTEERAKEILGAVRTYLPSGCVLENYGKFPDKLGLPSWLDNLLSTINHHNSNDFSGIGKNYEEYFYPDFLKACNVGVDYTLMFHKWELMILTEMVPKRERNKKYFLNLIELHKNGLAGKKSDMNKWFELQIEIDKILQNINEFTNVPKEVKLKELKLFENLNDTEKRKINHIELHNKAFSFRRYRNSFSKVIWNSGRVAFLSIENYKNQENPYTTSSEALVDVLLEEYYNENKPYKKRFEEGFRKRIWFELMEKLLIMIREWK